MVKKIIIFCFFFGFHMLLGAQTVYIKNGKNFTDFKFVQSDGTQSPGFQQGVGDAFDLGIQYVLLKKGSHLFGEVGVILNEYNALVGMKANYINWKTYYVGIQNSIVYSFLNRNNYFMGIRLGANANKILYGKEEIDGIIYDLRKENDFKRFLFQYVVGLDVKYNVTNQISIGLGFSLVNSSNMSNSDSTKFFINNKQVMASIFFIVNN